MFYKDKNLQKIEDTIVMQKQEIRPRQEQPAHQMSASTQALDVPGFIKTEFKFVLIIAFVWLALGLAGLTYGGINLYQVHNEVDPNFVGYILPGALTGYSMYKVIDCLLTIKLARSDFKRLEKDLSGGVHSVPRTLLKVMTKIYVRKVDVNWLAFTTYIGGGLILLINEYTGGKTIPLINVTLDYSAFTTQIFFLKIILVAVFVLHIAFHIITRSKLEKINNFYGYDLIPHAEVVQLKKARNAFLRKILFAILIIVGIGFFVLKFIVKRFTK